MKRRPKRERRVKCRRCEALEKRCAQLEEVNRRLARENRELKKRIEALEERLGLNSQNSSKSPSSDPPNAPPRPKKKSSSPRKRGGQPGHKGSRRELLPTSEVDEVVHHLPTHCERCRAVLPQETGLSDRPPARHQMTELREAPCTVTEHQSHATCCDKCGHVTRAELPPECRSAFGPRLVALVAMLTGVLKTSRRATQEFIEDALNTPISLGAVSSLESEVSASLEEAHEGAREAVSSAPRKNVDETGWKQHGAKRWLWAAATTAIAFYVIHRRRGKEGFLALLKEIRGIFTSDRWHVYAIVDKKRRQICWAHLKRDFLRMAQKRGKAGKLGKEAGTLTGLVFVLWKDFKAGEIDRQALGVCLRPLKTDLRELLEQGVALRQKGVSKFCQNLLDLEPALWNFTRFEGVEPTNNHAERVIRPAVLWRKRSFGSGSDRGCRYVERMLTAAESCRLQSRRIYTFLLESITAHRVGGSPPSLVRSGT